MGSEALRLVTSESEDDGTCAPIEDDTLPVPLWVYALDIGPALKCFLGFVAGRCRQRSSESIETSVGELIDLLPNVGDRTIKRWIEDLRAPLDDDQAAKSKYLRLGLLECSKADLKGRFRLTPLKPAAPVDGPRPAPRAAGPQRRLPGIEPEEEGSGLRVQGQEEEPQDFAQTPAVSPPQDFAQSPADGVARLLAELERLAGKDRFGDWFAAPTEWDIQGTKVTATVPHRSYLYWFRKLYRSVIGPACRTVFTGDGTFDFFVAVPPAPVQNDGGRDRPQDFAQSPAVPFKFKLSSLGSLSGNQENNFKVQVQVQVQACAPRILARAAELAAQFPGTPRHFFRWQWIEAAWAVEVGVLPAQRLAECVRFCHSRDAPHWQFAKSIKDCFGGAHVEWLDPRRPGERSKLMLQLRNAGLEWDEAWEGPAHGKPRPKNLTPDA